MNEIVNKHFLTEDKFMPEMYLKQTRLTYSACGLFYINKKLIQKFMQTENTNYIYRNNLGKACFQHDIAFT